MIDLVEADGRPSIPMSGWRDRPDKASNLEENQGKGDEENR